MAFTILSYQWMSICLGFVYLRNEKSVGRPNEAKSSVGELPLQMSRGLS